MIRTWRPDWPIDLDVVLAPLTRGRSDPVARRTGPAEWWLTGSTDSGPVALHLRRSGADIRCEAWGQGAEQVLDAAPHMLGDDDDPAGFSPAAGSVVAVQWRRHGRHWRVPATGFVFATAVQAVLEQKVTGLEARRSWFRLCADHGEPAPGPAPHGMRVPPDRHAVAAVPSWWWRDNGVDHNRAATLLRLSRTRLSGGTDQQRARLAAVPGVGPWTLAEVGFRALGDADAVSVGDYHLKNVVGYALTGRARGTDEQLLDLLDDYAGHRHRAVRMIELSGIAPPRFGPRATLPSHRGRD